MKHCRNDLETTLFFNIYPINKSKQPLESPDFSHSNGTKIMPIGLELAEIWPVGGTK
jgi:hypothetical protein